MREEGEGDGEGKVSEPAGGGRSQKVTFTPRAETGTQPLGDLRGVFTGQRCPRTMDGAAL